ncbi:MAG TPA: Ig-like domain-containing protein, partial [Prolixibacteraceae bacterium]|nr:Ig-like domain-containing protein [Prolixibacteraceae bacterium]
YIYRPSTGILTVNKIQIAGTYTFTYEVCDLDPQEPSCGSATVTLLVKALGSPFFAQNDYYETKEDSAFQLDPHPAANDINEQIGADPYSLEIVSGPQNGVSALNVNYYPERDYNGPDWMRYSIFDSTDVYQDIAEINIWVEPVNDPPVAVDDAYIVTKNADYRLYILKNDFDVDSELDWVSLDTIPGFGPRNGEVTVDILTGTILYEPGINEGEDSFTYAICDEEGDCATASVNLSIQLDTIVPVYAATPEDTPITIDIRKEMEDYKFFFDIEAITEELAPELGSWEFIENNTLLVYTPHPDLNGNDNFRLIVCPSEGKCATVNVRIYIIPVNDAPVAMNDTVTWQDETNPLQIHYSEILQNDYDVDLDLLTLTPAAMDQGPALQIEFHPDDSLILISAAAIDWCNNYFTYEIKDPGGLSDTATVSILPVLEGIEAYNDTFSVDENSSENRLDVLANDWFKDQQRCTIDSLIVIDPPRHGQAEGTPDRFIDYVPDRHYYGPDSLEYRIVDIWGQSSSAWMFLDVLERNMPPVAQNDDTLLVVFGGTMALPVLNNDYDPDAYDDPEARIDTTRTYLVPESGPEYGTVEFNPETGEFIYRHFFETCSDDQFQYTIFDNEGDSATATVFIDLPDEAPMFPISDTVRTYPGIPVEAYPLANDSGYFLPYIFDNTQPYNGYVTLDGDDRISYYPNSDFMGRDSMIYTLESPCGNTASAYIIFLIEELKVPEIISPNGDGKNDVLIIEGIHYFPGNMLQIFNRLGHVVYQMRDYDNRWGGYSNQGSLWGDKALPAGTYYYTLIYNEGKNRQAGFVYLFW